MSVPNWEGMLHKLANWGTLPLGAGVLLAVFAGKLAAALVPETRRETAAVILKFAALALAIIGAMRIFQYI